MNQINTSDPIDVRDSAVQAVETGATARKSWRRPELKILSVKETLHNSFTGQDGLGTSTHS